MTKKLLTVLVVSFFLLLTIKGVQYTFCKWKSDLPLGDTTCGNLCRRCAEGLTCKLCWNQTNCNMKCVLSTIANEDQLMNAMEEHGY